MLDNSRCGAALVLVSVLFGCEPILPRTFPDVEPVERVRQPVFPQEGEVSRNLLQGYIDRDPDVADHRVVADPKVPGQNIRVPVTWAEESRSWKLPFQAKRVVAALVIAAAHDRLESLRFILTPDAQWGWPDPRRPGARSVFEGDDGERFFQALRMVASRLPDKVKWTSNPVPPGIQMLHLTGAEPMWTFYAEGYDGILMQLVIYEGAARIAYIGLYEELPEERPTIVGYGAMPPLVPPLRPPPATGG